MRLDANVIPQVAVASMHNVHVEEVGMINAIYEMLEDIEAGGGGQAGLTESLDALLDHTREHFAGEEALMERHHFPPYPVHKAAHDAFLHDMEQMVCSWKSEQELEAVLEFMQDALPIWIMDHISTMDFVTANFVAMQMEQT